ncbi:MAG TPA: NAD(P)H-dependent oxidoreductase [Methanomassiliicoccales archaeon]|nr:NAD(P)H-dependent oxidoreductase [Methanomassiliicoccales archaeon]
MTAKALILIGSPRASKSTSHALGAYLEERLAEKGMEFDEAYAKKALASEAGWAELAGKMKAADLIVLSTPLYVDSFPAPVMAIYERAWKDGVPLRGKGFAVIMNSGFPEAFHMNTGLKIAEHFARKVGMDWLGGLAMGSGAAIDGKPLGQAGAMSRHAVKGLDMAADSLAGLKPISTEAKSEFAKPIMPRGFMVWASNRTFRRAHKKAGKGGLRDRPYQ